MMSFQRLSAALALASVLGACAAPQWVAPPSMTAEQARIAHYECVRDGQNMIAVSASNFLAAISQTTDCLHAHGFTNR